MLSLAKGERPLLYFGRKIHCKVLYVFSGQHGRAKIFFPIPEKFPEKGKTLVFVAAPPIWCCVQSIPASRSKDQKINSRLGAL